MRVLRIILMALAFVPLQAYAKDGRTFVVKENSSAGKRVSVVIGNYHHDAKRIAATSDCEEAYFSPDDHAHESPLQKPHPEFMKSYKLAKAGNAVEQRNVAVSYDAGYLVNACPEKAYYWYQKAAQNRDQIAQDWLVRYNKFKAIHDGPEFMRVSQAK